MSRIGLRVLAERDHEVVTTALGPQAREEEPRLLAGGRPDRGRARLLRADGSAREGARRARGVVLAPLRRLQGARVPRRARRLLPGPPRRPREDAPRCSATTATRPTPGPRSGACSRSACSATTARSTRWRGCARRRACSACRSPRDGSDSQDLARTVEALIHRERPHPRRGARAGAAADRQRDQGHARGAARLLHVPAPGVRAARAGSGGAGGPPRRRVRVLRRRARACARSGRWRPPTRSSSRASRAWSRSPTPWRSPSRSRPARS